MVSKGHNFGKVKDIGFNLIRRILKASSVLYLMYENNEK